MLTAILTLDYEIHGNGEGCPLALMVEPTYRLMQLCDAYDAKLTIMADVGEILRFKRHQEETGNDEFHYHEIATQLRNAVSRGHDVQLHIHSSYYNAQREAGRWVQDWSEYDFASLEYARILELVRDGKSFLESLLSSVDPHYRCHVFRAANWSMSPSVNAIRALVRNGITIDTSVFKYGMRSGLVNFDYRHAPSELVPWRVADSDICAESDTGKLWEFPIYTEKRWLGAFLTPQRVYRSYLGRKHRLQPSTRHAESYSRDVWKKLKKLDVTATHAWKADFNQCTGPQLARALRRAALRFDRRGLDLPFVLIGHSKLFTRLNGRSLRPFLAYVVRRPENFQFGRFGDFDTEALAATTFEGAAS